MASEEFDLKEAGARGGSERAKRLTPERKSQIAGMGALVRWSKQGRVIPILAKYGTPDRPLRIGPVEIPCYVLADGRRVLAQRGLQAGIGMSEGGGKKGARRLVETMASLQEKGIDTKDLISRANSPIRFIGFPRGKPDEATPRTDASAGVVLTGDIDGWLALCLPLPLCMDAGQE